MADLAEIDVRGTRLADVVRSFKPHQSAELQMQWQMAEAERLLA